MVKYYRTDESIETHDDIFVMPKLVFGIFGKPIIKSHYILNIKSKETTRCTNYQNLAAFATNSFPEKRAMPTLSTERKAAGVAQENGATK